MIKFSKHIYDNYNYFHKIKGSLFDPLAKEIADEIHWISLEKKWGMEKFPVLIYGKGAPILLIHGFDSSFLEFRRIFPLLKDKYKLIIPDLLGFGFSPRIPNYDFSPDNIVSNLLDILNEININQKINLLGASMGGSVALLLLNKIQEKIDKTILLSPAGLFEKSKNIPIPLNHMGAVFLGLPFIRKNLCRQAFAFPNRSVGLKEEQIASIHLGCKGWRNSLASFARSGGFGDTYKYYKDTPIKTICGENDRILGSKELNKFKKIKNLNSVNLRNCGHLPHLDLPELTSKIIIDFFN